LKTTKTHLYNVEWPLLNVMAITTTRKAPFPQPLLCMQTSQSIIASPYGGFNLGDHVGDSIANVLTNRKYLEKEVLEHSKIQWLKQVHEADVIDVITHSDKAYIADAAITRKNNLALAVMTADCLPILLSNKEGSEVAVIHGGWKPLVKNIIVKTLSKMESSSQDIYAWLGPCISQPYFEVGSEVKDKFITQDHSFSPAFSQSNKKNHFLADLHEIARIQLKKAGVNEIFSLPHCTYSQSQDYFSYRRDVITGRMASIIMINHK